MFEKFKSMLTMGDKKQKNFQGGVGSSCYSMGLGNTLAYYKQGSYDNTFPNISRIAETFMTIQPYAIDAKGEKLKTTPNLIKALYNPNAEMSGIDFFEALMVMALVHPTFYLLCWTKRNGELYAGGDISEKNIGGFTFLEYPTIIRNADGSVVYKKGTQQYTDKEVLAISLNVNPYSILDGYSPSLAAKKWSNIDDYIADYQAGFFLNGAKPAGELIITASTVEEFNDTVNKLQFQHRGAGQNNNMVYVHRPTSTIDGKPMNAQIEWVPFSQTNDSMALQTLFDQANKKIDMDFGVPQEIKGYLQNSNYASANVAEKVFDKYVVLPKALKIWAKFTHEMNRVTGGLGYAIGFDFKISSLADEDKIKAETTSVQLATLKNAMEAGFSMESAVDALGLPKEFRNLALTPQEAPEQPLAIEPEEDTASQAETSLKALKSVKKDVASDAMEYWKEVDPKLKTEVGGFLEKQVDAAVENKPFGNAEITSFAASLAIILLGILTDEGEKRYKEEYERAISAGANKDDLLGYTLSEEAKTTYQGYLETIAFSFSNDTSESIKKVLEQGEAEGWTQGKIEESLRNIMKTDEWRVRRLARTEQHRATMSGDIDAMLAIRRQTGLNINKTWHLNPGSLNPCEHCIEMDGKTVELDGSFGDFIVGDDMVADAHPNCTCYLSFDYVEKPTPTIVITEETLVLPKTVKVTCPKCGRYLFESEGGNAKNVICTNSKCKKHWDFNIEDGKIKSKETK